jgi:hypothetical protein
VTLGTKGVRKSSQSGRTGNDIAQRVVAADAHRLSESRHFRGKLVLQVR